MDIYTIKVEGAIKVFAEKVVVIEVSISVKQKDQDSWYPSDEMLGMAYHYVVFISFNSDVYTPNRISDDWEEVRQRLVIKI